MLQLAGGQEESPAYENPFQLFAQAFFWGTLSLYTEAM